MRDGHSRHFGEYTLLEVIGAGGSAQVWSACRGANKRDRVAIKILRRIPNSGGARNIERELRTIATVEHPGIVRVLGIVREGDRVGLVMELCRGSLADWLRIHGPLPAYWVARVGIDALSGLDAAHTAGVLHRDIKPGNLLVAQDGSVKLGDFGIAKLLEEDATGSQTSALWGTMPFVAPERRYARAVDARSDLYGIATTLACLAVGEVVGELFVPIVRERLRARLPSSLCEVLERGGAYAPDDRFPDAVTMRGVLREILETLPGCETIRLQDLSPLPALDTRTATTDPYPVDFKRRYAWTFGAAATAMSLGLVLGKLIGSEPDTSPPDVRAPLALPLCPDGSRSARSITRMGPRETIDGVAADLDEDGEVDLIFVNQLDETLTLYWGGGDGFLTEPLSLAVGRVAARPAIGDVDLDGRLDLILPQTDDAQLLLVRGGPDRTFTIDEPIFQAPPPGRLALIDWDLDGVPDLLFQGRVNDRCTAWRRGRGDGTFEPHSCIGPPSDLLQPYGTRPPAVYRKSADGVLLRHLRSPEGALGPSEVVSDLAPLGAAGSGTLMVRDLDGDDTDEVYVAAVGRVDPALLRVAPTGKACKILAGLNGDPTRIVDVADVDDNGLVDVVLRATCQGCESNHALFLGVEE